MLTEGTILQGRYRIVRQLGQGGMGAVYEAVDERLDTTVALKETLFTEEKLRKQFEREARLLARMHHPALPR
ncbi:MAG TPA: serine/threonine protein kinase, partial [Pyrinomonadaceae bacterium]|nr:serine/threonine protein kinase [Pyrinomonadaceae bacterium]